MGPRYGGGRGSGSGGQIMADMTIMVAIGKMIDEDMGDDVRT